MRILEPGTRVGKFPITRLMSAGGMGMLYEAVHPVLGHRVVIKTIRPELTDDQDVVNRFIREAVSAAKVRDARLPQIYDQDVMPDGTPYMVMEYLEGHDLAARLRAGPLVPHVATRIVVEVLEVLHKVHHRGIVHRDIKPQNIFLSLDSVRGEVPKLLDFGVAHFVGEQATRPGQAIGTPMYMALEQSDSELRIGPWTDVFAAGVVLYECIAGPNRRPWGQVSAMEYLTGLQAGRRPTPLHDVAIGAPAGLCDAVMKAVSIQPAARYPDAQAFARALEPYAAPRADLFERVPTPIDTRPARLSRPPGTPTPATGIISNVSGRVGANDLVQRMRARLGRGDPTPEPRLESGARHHVVVLACSYRVEALEDLSNDAIERIGELVHEVLEEACRAASAKVESPVPESLVVVFGLDGTSEDDAAHAVRLALKLLEVRDHLDEALNQDGLSVVLQGALHAGFVTQRRGRSRRLGEATETTRRLEGAAPLNRFVASSRIRDAAVHAATWTAAGTANPGRGLAAIDLYELGPRTEASSVEADRARPFVGRELQLAELAASLDAPAAGLHFTAVVGPAGVGKSRLLDELANQVADNTTNARMVVRARPDALRPYALWAEVANGLLFGDPALSSPNRLASRLRVLGAGLPRQRARRLMAEEELVQLLLGFDGRLEAGHGLGDRVQAVLTDLLEAAACQAKTRTGRALLVLLDDMHRADEASLELLRRLPVLLADAKQAPAVLLGGRAFEDFGLPDEAAVTSVALGPLDPREIDALVDMLVSGRPVSDAVRGLVADRAGGSPLFIEELVSSIEGRGLLQAGALELADLRLPDSLYGLLLARVSRLPSRLQEVVRHLSVLGERVEATLWNRVSDGLLDADQETRLGRFSTPIDELHALVQHRILARAGDEDGTFVFRQVLLCEAVYSTVLPANRRLLHRLVAQAIEANHPDDPRRWGALLHHYREADAVEPTVRYGRLVGRQTAALGANVEAVAALRTAAALQLRVPDEPALNQASTLVDLAWVCMFTGLLDEALAQAAEAGVLVEDDPSPAALELRARAHTAAGQVAYLRTDWEHAQSELEMAEHLFTQADHPLDAAYAQSMLGFVLRTMGRPGDGLPLCEDAWQTITAANHWGVLRAAHDFGNTLRSLGRLEEAIAVFDVGLEHKDAATHRGRLGPTEGWLELAIRSGRGIALADLDRLDEALVDQRWAYKHIRRTGRRVGMVVAGSHLARLLVKRGRPTDLAEAEPLARQIVDLAGVLGLADRGAQAHLLLADLAKRADRADQHRAHLEAAEFVIRGADGAGTQWLEIAQALAELYENLSRPADARALVARGQRLALSRRDPDFRAAIEAWVEATGYEPEPPVGADDLTYVPGPDEDD